jgi:hypothetical protein
MKGNFARQTYVSPEKCLEIGTIISGYPINPLFRERPFLRQKADNESIARCCLFSVSICHQTHKLYNSDLDLYGWDYLEHVFCMLGQSNSPLIDPSYIISEDHNSLKRKYEELFPESSENRQTTLDQIDERIELLKETALFICQSHKNNVIYFYESTGNKLLNNGVGFYDQLLNTTTFADPWRKKSTFLLKLLIDCKLYQVTDIENLVPIMDYHMQRVLLRTGAVEIADKDLADALHKHELLKDDTGVRETCIEAMKLIALCSRRSVLAMNDIFWPLGRSCCYNTPNCSSGSCEKNPCTLSLTIELDSPHKCIFTDVCKGAKDEEYRNYWQPVVITNYY